VLVSLAQPSDYQPCVTRRQPPKPSRRHVPSQGAATRHDSAAMDDRFAEPSSMLPDYGAVAGTRRYRSKAQRPCDLCRARKVLCNIPDPSQPCQLCTRIGRNCTFVGNPGKRQQSRAAAKGNSPSSAEGRGPGNGQASAMDVSPSGGLISQGPGVGDDRGFGMSGGKQL
jgi:Zn(2)-Cys(6) binuclear cluster domain-containing protein